MKTKLKSSFLVAIIFAGLMVPLIFTSFMGTASAADPSFSGSSVIVYSETTVGEHIDPIVWNLWNGGEMALADDTLSPYEGAISAELTVWSSVWWGMGLEKAGTVDMSRFAGGYLVLAINTTYSGVFDVGFQSAGQDAFMPLNPGSYGYNNDGAWYEVIIPIADIVAVNPSVDLSAILNVFVIFDNTAPVTDSIYIDDIYWLTGPPKTIIYSETELGDHIDPIVWNLWNGGEMALADDTLSPYEGAISAELTVWSSVWWGMGLEKAGTVDMSAFDDGYLVLAINTTYSGVFDVGFQSAGQDAFMPLNPGSYGYNNDGAWHQVVIPIADIVAVNPSVDLSAILNVFVIFDNTAPVADSIYFDNVYWLGGPPKTLVYSETTVGEHIDPIVWNLWNGGEMALADDTLSPYEGAISAELTVWSSVWWGMGLEKAGTVDFSDYADGYLVLSLNTTYSGVFDVGFQSAGQDAFMPLNPGSYGYTNDGAWHQVVIPIADIVAVNPSVDLSAILNVFVIFDNTAPVTDSIYIDNIYWQDVTGAPVVVPPSVSDVGIQHKPGSGELVLSYSYTDPESDPDMSLIVWSKNGTPMPIYENMTVIPSSALVVGDEWNATVTPYDGIDVGIPVDSNMLEILAFDGKWFIYDDYLADVNHYAPTGWFGDAGDITMDENATADPYTGDSYINITYDYNANPGGDPWAGVFWQYPDSNWGGSSLGYDLEGAIYLRFWARGKTGNEKIEFKVGGIYGVYSDTIDKTLGYLNLTSEWQEYIIDLRGEDLTRIAGGFMWVTDAGHSPTATEFYLDNIYFDFLGKPPVVSDVNLEFNEASGYLELSYTYSDPEGDSDNSEIRWYRNGALVAEFNDQNFVPDWALTEDDEWYVEITPFDGVNTNTVIISNTVTVPEPSWVLDPTIPGFPIIGLLGFAAIALLFTVRKYKK